jgi:hypothetical protein
MYGEDGRNRRRRGVICTKAGFFVEEFSSVFWRVFEDKVSPCRRKNGIFPKVVSVVVSEKEKKMQDSHVRQKMQRKKILRPAIRGTRAMMQRLELR